MKRLHEALGLLGLLACFAVRADMKDDVLKLLVGRWEVKQKSGDRELTGLMTFSQDGKVAMKMKGTRGDITFNGSYKLLSATKMELTFTIFDKEMTEEREVKITKDTLELTDKNKNVQRMTRLK